MAQPPTIASEPGLWLELNIQSVGLTDEQFLRLCRDNEEFRIETTASGELIIMSPTGADTDRKNAEITLQLGNWAKQDGSGEFFGSSAIFTLPNGARRVPDGAWIAKTRWKQIPQEQRDSLTPICPDFVIELRSTSDRLPKLRKKMEEYIANGARLAWLLDPIENRATIYRPGAKPEQIDSPRIITGDPVLPGFRFDFREIM